MSNRKYLHDPGVLEAILKGIDETPREYWLEMLARYDNEKPGDIILPGVPLDRIKKPSTPAPKKSNGKKQKAA